MKKVIIAGALMLTLAGGVVIGSQTAMQSEAAGTRPVVQPVGQMQTQSAARMAEKTTASDAASESYRQLCNNSIHAHDGVACSLAEDCPNYDQGQCNNDICNTQGAVNDAGRHYRDNQGYTDNNGQGYGCGSQNYGGQYHNGQNRGGRHHR